MRTICCKFCKVSMHVECGRPGAARNKAARGELLLRAGSPTGNPEEGRDLLREACDELGRLFEQNPENFDYHSDLMRTEELLRR